MQNLQTDDKRSVNACAHVLLAFCQHFPEHLFFRRRFCCEPCVSDGGRVHWCAFAYYVHAITEYAHKVSRAAMQFRSQAYLSVCRSVCYSLFLHFARRRGRLSACATLRVHSITVFFSLHILRIVCHCRSANPLGTDLGLRSTLSNTNRWLFVIHPSNHFPPFQYGCLVQATDHILGVVLYLLGYSCHFFRLPEGTFIAFIFVKWLTLTIRYTTCSHPWKNDDDGADCDALNRKSNISTTSAHYIAAHIKVKYIFSVGIKGHFGRFCLCVNVWHWNCYCVFFFSLDRIHSFESRALHG